MRKRAGMKIILQAVTLALFVSAASAAEPFSYKGIPMGSTEQALLAKYPEFQCRTADRYSPSDRKCIFTSGTYAGIEAIKTELGFHSNRLEYIEIVFASVHSDTVYNALIAKHGRPTTTFDRPTYDGNGNEFKGKATQWEHGTNGNIIAVKSANFLINSRVGFISNYLLADMEKRRKAKRSDM